MLLLLVQPGVNNMRRYEILTHNKYTIKGRNRAGNILSAVLKIYGIIIAKNIKVKN